LELNLENDNSSNGISFKDLIPTMLAFIGVIVGGFLTYFVGVLKERPIKSRVRQLVYYELIIYKEFLQNLKQNDECPENDDFILLDMTKKEKNELELRLNDLLISHYWSMTFEQKVGKFKSDSLYNLETVYREFRVFTLHIYHDFFIVP
jgi:hypothetical protein